VALGATTLSHLTGAGVPWAVALVFSGLLLVPVGAMVAVPAMRLSGGLYLALATFGFALLMQLVIYPSSWMFGFSLSAKASRPQLGPLDASDTALYFVVLAVVVISVVAIVAICRTRLGRLLRAMSETPTMLATHGLGVNMTRLIVFSISAFFAGIAGALQVTQFHTVNSLSYGPLQSLLFVAVLAIFGTRLLRGSILAAMAMTVLPRYALDVPALAFLNDVDRQMLVFGSSAIVAAVVVAKRSDMAAWLAAHTPDGAVARSATSAVTIRAGAVEVPR
jgi:ABC-type branched-subunit amino acid transport system permease subunit